MTKVSLYYANLFKLQAVAAHASQVVEAASFMGLPPGAFHRLLSVEWYRPAQIIDGRFNNLVGAGCGTWVAAGRDAWPRRERSEG